MEYISKLPLLSTEIAGLWSSYILMFSTWDIYALCQD